MSIVRVDCENLNNNPKCAHGPTLKFSRLVKDKVKTFYACAAYRDRKDCPFFLLEGEQLTDSKKLALEEWKKNAFPVISYETVERGLKQFKELKSKIFCLTCFNFVFPEDYKNHKSHSLKCNISNDEFNYPTKIISALTKNKSEAQYWFSDKTIHFILDNIQRQNISKVLCIGAPTISEVLRAKGIECLLLDIDHRYHWFYNSCEYIWFNMFNFHFMGRENSDKPKLNSFLSNSVVTTIIDPPFGARLEPLKRTINKLNKLTSKEFYIYLILPYFMEPQVLSSFPDFNMLDFPVDYSNHKKFKEKLNKKSKQMSPIRIFTNVNLNKFSFPINEGYHYCEICEAWKSRLNTHCDLCNLCPSKNGEIYKHCFPCSKCVKNTWIHCSSCEKCTPPEHSCSNTIKKSFVSNKRKKRKH